MLTDANRVRHGRIFFDVILPILINDAKFKNLDTGKTVARWKWGITGKRLGYTKSADGVVFDLSKKAPGGDSVVAKVILSYDKYPEEEARIARKAGNAGIGPHIYGIYKFELPKSSAKDIEDAVDDEGLGPLNLLKGPSTKITPYVYIIIMENMYHNPKRGVTSAKVLAEYTNRKQFLPEIRRKIERLHQLGIAHGDMHMGNIMIQTVKSPTGKTRHVVKIIDYGRSLNKSSALRGPSSANRLVMAGSGKLSPGGRHFERRSGVPRLLQKVAWKEIASKDTQIRVASRSRSQSYLESRERSSPSVPKREPSMKPSVSNIPLARLKYGFNAKGRPIKRGPRGGLYVEEGKRKIYKPLKRGNARILTGKKGGLYYMKGARKVYI